MGELSRGAAEVLVEYGFHRTHWLKVGRPNRVVKLVKHNVGPEVTCGVEKVISGRVRKRSRSDEAHHRVGGHHGGDPFDVRRGP